METFLTLFELPMAMTDTLAKLSYLTLFVDMTQSSVGGWVEATHKIAGASTDQKSRLDLLATVSGGPERGPINGILHGHTPASCAASSPSAAQTRAFEWLLSNDPSV